MIPRTIRAFAVRGPLPRQTAPLVLIDHSPPPDRLGVFATALSSETVATPIIPPLLVSGLYSSQGFSILNDQQPTAHFSDSTRTWEIALMDAQSPPSSCQLHLDVLELIIKEHRDDHATLTAMALASQSFLQMARRHLYRYVSLDYCENPYGYEQQRQLRLSLASNPHLCFYIRNLRLSLPVTKALDADLDDILHALSRVENFHVIGNASSLGYHVVNSTHPTMFGSVELGSMGTTTTRSGRSLDKALRRVLGLTSLRKVKLENIDPLEEVYVSCFTQLKHLELLCVGGGPFSLDPLPQSSSDASSIDTASSNAASLSPSRSTTSVASHPPPSLRSTPSPLRSSPSSSASHGDASLVSSPDAIAASDEDRRGTLSLGPEIALPRTGLNTAFSGTSGCTRLSYSTGDPDDSFTNLVGGIPTIRPVLPEFGSMKQNGMAVRKETSTRKVRLEYLVLNLERLRPVLDVICRGAGSFSNGKEVGSVLDFSRLKQAHIYVWGSLDDVHAVWSILGAARKSLEQLTLRYFDFGDEHTTYHQGFDNLHSLVLGTRTFSVRDDPFRPLIRFLGDPSKLPSLRRVKISFDLWGCENDGVSWKEVCGYRGWRELDDVFARLDGTRALSRRAPSSLASSTVLTGDPQLLSVVFELWCSPTYKMSQGGHAAGEARSLVALVREELSYLKHNRQFLVL